MSNNNFCTQTVLAAWRGNAIHLPRQRALSRPQQKRVAF